MPYLALSLPCFPVNDPRAPTPLASRPSPPRNYRARRRVVIASRSQPCQSPRRAFFPKAQRFPPTRQTGFHKSLPLGRRPCLPLRCAACSRRAAQGRVALPGSTVRIVRSDTANLLHPRGMCQDTHHRPITQFWENALSATPSLAIPHRTRRVVDAGRLPAHGGVVSPPVLRYRRSSARP